MSDSKIKVFDANLALQNFDAFQKMSTVFAESWAFPKTMNAPKFVVLMQAWYDLWLSPTEAIRSLAIINGNVSMFWTKVIERVRQWWYSIKLKEDLWEEIYEKDWKKFKRIIWFCEATVVRISDSTNNSKKNNDNDSRTEKYTVEEARSAGLMSKDNWVKHTKLMLRYRAIGQCVKFFCPEVLWWVSMYEEIKDHQSKESPSFEKITDAEILDWFESKVTEKVVEGKETKLWPKSDQIKNNDEVTLSDFVLDKGASVKHALLGVWVVKDTFQNNCLVEFDSWIKKIEKNQLWPVI